MTWKSAEEVEAEYLAVLGPELGPLFYALTTDLTWTHWRWRQYRVLFGDKPSRIDLLNETAPLFFRIVQDVFFEDTLMAISRLAGPARSMGKDNLSVARLPALMNTRELKAKLEALVATAVDAAAFAKDWRNRHIAHRDLALALGGAEKPLEPASRQAIEDALKALRAVLSAVESAYRNSTTAYDIVPGVQDAESLLYVLRDGLRFDADRQARWDRGEFHEDDVKPPPPI